MSRPRYGCSATGRYTSDAAPFLALCRAIELGQYYRKSVRVKLHVRKLVASIYTLSIRAKREAVSFFVLFFLFVIF